jgi:hypothetical protein
LAFEVKAMKKPRTRSRRKRRSDSSRKERKGHE